MLKVKHTGLIYKVEVLSVFVTVGTFYFIRKTS